MVVVDHVEQFINSEEKKQWINSWSAVDQQLDLVANHVERLINSDDIILG